MPRFENPVSGSVRVWLRLEGMATLLVAVCLYRVLRASWPLVAILFLAPDITMFVYFAGARAGAVAYNIAHSYFLPLALAAFAFTKGERAALPYVLIWIAHIGFDRALGYGLKYPSAFGHTHLGWIGRQKLADSPGLS